MHGDSSGLTAGTATLATTITATANEATSETVYITFVDGTTGAQGIETDTGLTYNPSLNWLTTTFTTGTLMTPTQSVIATILNSSLVLGRDADNQIKFSTDNNIIFRFNGSDGVTMNASGLSCTGDITALTSDKRLKKYRNYKKSLGKN